MFDLKPKQSQIVDIANDPTIHTIVLIGSIGTGKSDVAAYISISIADKYRKTFWPVIRQNLSTAKKSIIPSYLNMLDMMNYYEGKDFNFNRQDNTITFPNKTVIAFIEADITKDRQGRKIKGINATGNHIDEADELHQTMFITATSRRGRRNTNGQPSISIVTMNPNDTYLKDLYYKPYKDGTLPPGVVVIEFNIEDSFQTKQDIDAMLLNPKPWVQRYIYNNWNYHDDDLSLFKYKYFDAALTSDIDLNSKRFAGVDVARSGNDRSVISLWYGRTLVDIRIMKTKDESITTDVQAMKLIKYATQNALVYENIAVDAVGIGVGLVDHLHSKGLSVKEFVSGARPTVDKYDSLRSQVIFELAQGLEKGTIKIYEGCPFRNELISEAMVHNHEIGAKKLKVESKEEIKKRTGSVSPDIMDAVVMGLYPQLDLDPLKSTGRIIY